MIVEFSLMATPPSMNTNAVRTNWRGFHRLKKRWQEDFGKMLMSVGAAENVKRPIVTDGPLKVDVLLTFPTAHRRDSENFRGVLSKALGDALTDTRWLLDDTDAQWRLNVAISPIKGEPETAVTMTWREAT